MLHSYSVVWTAVFHYGSKLLSVAPIFTENKGTKCVWIVPVNRTRDKGSRAGEIVDGSSNAPGPRDLSPRLQTSQPTPEKQELQIMTGRRRTME